jgi:two-component system, NarL family, sensor kinase
MPLNSLLGAVIETSISFARAEAGCAGLRKAEGMVCERYFRRSKAVPLKYCWAPGRGLPGLLIENSAAYLTNDIRRDKRAAREFYAGLRVRSALSVPIQNAAGAAIGFIEVHNKKASSHFTDSDVSKLVALAQIASPGIQAFQTVERDRDQLRKFSARLMRLEEEERRRISRELHDATGQMFDALAMNLAIVRKSEERLTEKARLALAESVDLVERCSREVRTLSHLLHPPLLDELGLAAALRAYAAGFTRRSGIEVGVELPDRLGRFSREVEIALFRAIQEGLTNVRRHSGSRRAAIRLLQKDRELILEIHDEGKGMPREVQEKGEAAARMGVGLPGIEERMRDLGGLMEVSSTGGAGTTIRLIVPLSPSSL